jgi:D-glycero-D-manno-heptose 1,7-bisphosphate phosphatase
MFSHLAKRAIFLDRDGVLNRALVLNGKPYPPGSLDNLVILPGVTAALNKLKEAGFLLIVVTNQPDVSRGKVTKESIEAINTFLCETLPIDDFRTCYHDDSDCCNCRKPKPGALIDASRLHGIDLKSSFMVGDRWRDIEAGHAAGCKTIFLDYGYSERRPLTPYYCVNTLEQAIPYILGETE